MNEFADFLPPGEHVPTPSTLSVDYLIKLHRHLFTNNAYENLSIYHGTALPSLTPADLIAKFSSGRGGFCLELNTFYYLILQSLGYDVVKRSAVVLLNHDGVEKRPDTHLALIVTLNGERWMCDIGASEFSPMCPVLLTDPTPVLGAGGFSLSFKTNTFSGTQGYAMSAWQKTKQPIETYVPFYFFLDIEQPEQHYADMTARLSSPATCPPRPYFTEFATKAFADGSRTSVIGSAKSGYTCFRRNVDGVMLSSVKLAGSQQLKATLLCEIGIALA